MRKEYERRPWRRRTPFRTSPPTGRGWRRSLAYLPLYGGLRPEKLDVSRLTPEEAAARLEGGL